MAVVTAFAVLTPFATVPTRTAPWPSPQPFVLSASFDTAAGKRAAVAGCAVAVWRFTKLIDSERMFMGASAGGIAPMPGFRRRGRRS